MKFLLFLFITFNKVNTIKQEDVSIRNTTTETDCRPIRQENIENSIKNAKTETDWRHIYMMQKQAQIDLSKTIMEEIKIYKPEPNKFLRLKFLLGLTTQDSFERREFFMLMDLLLHKMNEDKLKTLILEAFIDKCFIERFFLLTKQMYKVQNNIDLFLQLSV